MAGRDLNYSPAEAKREIESYAENAIDCIKTIARGATETLRLNAEGLPSVPLNSADAAAIFDFETSPEQHFAGLEVQLQGGYGPRDSVRFSRPLQGGRLRFIVTVVRLK